MRVPPDQSYHLRPGFGQRYIHVPIAQRPGHVGEPGAEDEAIDPVAIFGHRMHEMQEHPRVARHRAGDVAQHRPAAAAFGAAARNFGRISSPPVRSARAHRWRARSIRRPRASGLEAPGRAPCRPAGAAAAIALLAPRRSRPRSSARSPCRCSTSRSEKVKRASTSISDFRAARFSWWRLALPRLTARPAGRAAELLCFSPASGAVDRRQQHLHHLLEQFADFARTAGRPGRRSRADPRAGSRAPRAASSRNRRACRMPAA